MTYKKMSTFFSYGLLFLHIAISKVLHNMHTFAYYLRASVLGVLVQHDFPSTHTPRPFAFCEVLLGGKN